MAFQRSKRRDHPAFATAGRSLSLFFSCPRGPEEEGGGGGSCQCTVQYTLQKPFGRGERRKGEGGVDDGIIIREQRRRPPSTRPGQGFLCSGVGGGCDTAGGKTLGWKIEGGDDSSMQKDMKRQSQQTIVSGQLLLRDIFPEFPYLQTHLSLLSFLPLPLFFLLLLTLLTLSFFLPLPPLSFLSRVKDNMPPLAAQQREARPSLFLTEKSFSFRRRRRRHVLHSSRENEASQPDEEKVQERGRRDV